ncbi:SUKH-4 family immunity protein [Kitasatospora sp. NPDC088346]|uniref:SUKH-4 family immunity protein n=1 Tax=Kitasatospora sp. NPDC088346 TaxID=3364073 RepID=UPI00381C5878
MITQEQALATADGWLNGSASAGQHREVRHREFALGWVVWAAPAPLERDPVTGERRPPADLGDACGVVDRGTGELTVWPSVPVDEVIRQYTGKHAPASPLATGPGNTAVATYRDPAGSDEVLVYRNAGPGLPPVEHQLAEELDRLGVPAGDVVAVHTDLRPATLPGGYPAVLLERYPNAELSCSHTYGIFADERAEGAAALAEHAERVARLAGQAPPPRPRRAPAPQPGDVTPAEPVRDVALGRRLSQTFGELIRHDADDLAACALPEAARSTLTWAGLPADLPLFFSADRPDSPPAGGILTDLRTHLRAAGTGIEEPVLDVLAGWTRIGTDGFCVIAVRCTGDERGLGSVWAVHPRTGSGRYVNGSVSAFLRSLELLSTSRAAMPGMDPLAAGAAVAALQNGLAEIDPDAFHKESTWWNVIVDQMWHGLF